MTEAAFAHASEAELARILDYYQVRWEYEPRRFPIQWNLEGKVVESFTPDFYLPDLHLFIELTTLKQSLVRKKNRKLRRLRELYPDVRIKLLYARDFKALMLKYGRIDLAASLTGPEGQVRVARAVEPAGASGGREDGSRRPEGAKLPAVDPVVYAGSQPQRREGRRRSSTGDASLRHGRAAPGERSRQAVRRG